MRTIDELIEFMDWPGDVNYEELMKQKRGSGVSVRLVYTLFN